ncbi:MAG: MBL fold metallo-hydrolase, partial [Thermoleophilaceae bacterium]
ESDRVLIAGDVVNTMHPFTMKRGVREPLDAFTPDPPRNRESIKRIAGLEPSLLLVGHGPPVRDPQKLKDLAARF